MSIIDEALKIISNKFSRDPKFDKLIKQANGGIVVMKRTIYDRK